MISFLLLFNVLLTILIEGILIFLLFRRWGYVYYSFLCNILTNPALNLLLLAAVQFWDLSVYWVPLVLLELAAVAVEAYVYKLLCRLHTGKAVAVSLALNTFSFAAGWLLYRMDFIRQLFR